MLKHYCGAAVQVSKQDSAYKKKTIMTFKAANRAVSLNIRQLSCIVCEVKTPPPPPTQYHIPYPPPSPHPPAPPVNFQAAELTAAPLAASVENKSPPSCQEGEEWPESEGGRAAVVVTRPPYWSSGQQLQTTPRGENGPNCTR